MNIKEIQQEKEFLRKDVTALLLRFYERTGVSVRSLDVCMSDCHTIDGSGPGYIVTGIASELDI